MIKGSAQNEGAFSLSGKHPQQLDLDFSRGEPNLRLTNPCTFVSFVRNRRAKRYILRLRTNGALRVTIPRGGTLRGGRLFVERSAEWIRNQRRRAALETPRDRCWVIGTEVWLRGNTVRLGAGEASSQVRLGPELISSDARKQDLRPDVEQHLRGLAAAELPRRTQELAAMYGIKVSRVLVRNQRSRWGSCSCRGTVSLNWRLVQVPEFVRDYIILHELAHLRHMNHSSRFWAVVAELCPGFGAAEAWLKQHSKFFSQ
jgi:predicted metal-dependent hydrolase